jgi:hypothetical protein
VVTGVFTIPLLAADHATRDSAHRSSRKAVIDRFIGGPENQFLPAALQAFFAEDTCLQSVSPLLLWGGPGSGKTYLASGLATRWAKQHPLRRVWFLNAGNIHTDRLTNDWLSDKFDKLVVIDGVDRLLPGTFVLPPVVSSSGYDTRVPCKHAGAMLSWHELGEWTVCEPTSWFKQGDRSKPHRRTSHP